MEPNNKSKEISKKSKIYLEMIRSKYILKNIFNYLKRNIFLQIIKKSKKEQNRFNISIKDYQEFPILYSDIIIEITPAENKYGRFINFVNNSDKKYISIYFGNSYRKIKRDKLNENEKVEKIKIIINYKVKSLNNLFGGCKCIEAINFKRFYRNNISNMSSMFSGCSSLKKIELNHFNTLNVTNMSNMFFDCPLLEEINLSNFNTNKVTNMKSMFKLCSSLKEINVSNFNTNKVKNMESMFSGCSSLELLDLTNFNTDKLENTSNMLNGCSALKDLKLPNFKVNNQINMDHMFYKCPVFLLIKIKNENQTIKPEAWIDI